MKTNKLFIRNLHNSFRKQITMVFILLFVGLLSVVNAQAQTKPVENIPPCFCCDKINAYQLIPPPITGPKTICPCPPVNFTTVQCPGATVVWTVVNNAGAAVNFTGQSTSSITLTFPLPVNTTSLTISVKLSCDRQSVQNQITVPVTPMPNAGFPYSITADGNGGYVISATGLAGHANAWRVTQILPDNLPCSAWGYGPVLVPDVASMNVTWSGSLIPGKTYRIIHWVEICSPTYIASDCRVTQWVCFTITPMHGMTPKKGTAIALSNVSLSPQINELTPEMKKSLSEMQK